MTLRRGKIAPDSDCSANTLGLKAGRLIKRVKLKVKRKDLGEENLKGLRGEINLMVKLLRRSGEHEHEGVTEKLIHLKDYRNDKLDSAKKRDRKQQQQPKGKLPEWDGMCESYLDFKAAMHDLLVYDSEYLGFSTLKSQIAGKIEPMCLVC